MRTGARITAGFVLLTALLVALPASRGAGEAPLRVLATLPSVDRIAIDPAGTGVAISAAQTIRFVAFDGRASDLLERLRGERVAADAAKAPEQGTPA